MYINIPRRDFDGRTQNTENASGLMTFILRSAYLAAQRRPVKAPLMAGEAVMYPRPNG
jgi:hypothetical protein